MSAYTRADTLTTTQKKLEYYSDFLNDFAVSPFGNELGRVTNEKSVNQSLRNLIKTNFNERLFQPTLGSDVYNNLFELNGLQNTQYLLFSIEQCIRNSEPRASIIDISIDDASGSNVSKISKYPGYQASPSLNENEISITIIYSLINSPDPITLSILLKRVR
jgi:phage baseplate assembly protein W